MDPIAHGMACLCDHIVPRPRLRIPITIIIVKQIYFLACSVCIITTFLGMLPSPITIPSSCNSELQLGSQNPEKAWCGVWRGQHDEIGEVGGGAENLIGATFR